MLFKEVVMSVFKLGKFEVSNEAFIKGAVTAVGAGVFLLGIKNFLDARRIRLIRETPIDEDEEFEIYLEQKETRLAKRQKSKVKKGIVGVTVGAVTAAIGVLSFTPAKKIVLESDAFNKAKDYDIKKALLDSIVRKKLSDIDIAKKIKDSDIAQKLSEVDIAQKIKESDLAQKIIEADIAQKISEAEITQKIKEKLS